MSTRSARRLRNGPGGRSVGNRGVGRDGDLRRDGAVAAQDQDVAPALQPQPGVVESAVERVEHDRGDRGRGLGDEPPVDQL